MEKSLIVRYRRLSNMSLANILCQQTRRASHLALSSVLEKSFKDGTSVLLECQLAASVDLQYPQTWPTAASRCPAFLQTALWSSTLSCWRSSEYFAATCIRIRSVCSSDRTIVDITSKTRDTTLLYCKNLPTPLT